MAKTLHVGAYAEVGQAYAAVDWLVGHGYAAEGDPGSATSTGRRSRVRAPRSSSPATR